MQSTCRPSASARSRSPTARAVWPPTPASTSSKTSVRDSPAPATVISASMTRDSSPPDAASRMGAAGTPGLGASRNSTRSAPVGADLLPRFEDHLELRPLHRERRQLLADALGELRRGLLSRGRDLLRQPVALGERLRERRLRTLGLDLRVRQPGVLLAAALGVREHRGDAPAVLALEPVVEVEPLLDDVEPAGLRLERVGVAAQLRARGPPPRAAGS